MEKTKEHESYAVKKDVDFGSVRIADEVIAMIAGLAATEVDGVSAMAGNIGTDLLSKVGVKNLAKGVRIDVSGKEVKAVVAIVVAYGYNIPSVSSKVQEKVKQAIESMTCLNVTDVDVKVAGIDVQNR